MKIGRLSWRPLSFGPGVRCLLLAQSGQCTAPAFVRLADAGFQASETNLEEFIKARSNVKPHLVELVSGLSVVGVDDIDLAVIGDFLNFSLRKRRPILLELSSLDPQDIASSNWMISPCSLGQWKWGHLAASNKLNDEWCCTARRPVTFQR